MKKILFCILILSLIPHKSFSKGVNDFNSATKSGHSNELEDKDAKFSRELSKKIVVDYDKYNDVTSINNVMSFVNDTFQLKGPKGEGTGLNLWVLISFNGKHSGKNKPDIILSFTHVGENGWDYLDCHDLGLLINGKVSNLGELKHSGNVLTGSSVSEAMNMHLTYKQFLKLKNAKTVEGKICNTEFVFGDVHKWTLNKIDELYKGQK